MTTELTISRLPADRLDDAQLIRWSALQQANPELRSPYFRSEYTQAVAAVCEGIEVAIFEQHGETVGFLPYQRLRGNRAIPVGNMLTDYQGLICETDVQFDPNQFLRNCDLQAWDFNNLLASQSAFAASHVVRASAPYLDLSQGFDAFLADPQRAGSGRIKDILRRGRKLGREVGPLRLESPTTDQEVFETLLDWKREQYHRTQAPDVFRLSWPRPLLEQIFEAQSDEFAGVLSALYAGDRLVASAFGMRSGDVLHYWFIAYDPTLPSKYSPGHMLLLEIARTAEEQGIRRIDLSKGPEEYKRLFTSGEVEVAEGSVDRGAVSRFVKQGWIRTRERISNSMLYRPARATKRMMRSMRDRLPSASSANAQYLNTSLTTSAQPQARSHTNGDNTSSFSTESQRGSLESLE